MTFDLLAHAKRIVYESNELTVPANSDLGAMKIARIDGQQLVAEFATETVAVEIYVTQRVASEQIKSFAERKLAALEIDLSYHLHVDADEDAWRQIVLHTADRSWLFPPKARQRQLERGLQDQIAAQREREVAALAVMGEAEQLRVVEQKRVRELEDQQAAPALIREQMEVLKLRRTQERQAQDQVRREQDELQRQDRRTLLMLAMGKHVRTGRDPPDLQRLVKAHGAYTRITSAAWSAWDARMKHWKQRARDGMLH